jgi:hypothetical protein
MSGLTVIGDIQVLYDSVKDLENSVNKAQQEAAAEYKTLFNDILDRLEKLEAFCFEDRILQEADSSWDIVRAKRDYLLRSTDWTAVSGCTVSPVDWIQYRQQLRDLPQTFAKARLDQIVWPTPPSTLGPHTIEEEEEI